MEAKLEGDSNAQNQDEVQAAKQAQLQARQAEQEAKKEVVARERRCEPPASDHLLQCSPTHTHTHTHRGKMKANGFEIHKVTCLDCGQNKQ